MTNQQNGIVVGLGEVLWDLFDHDRRPGGATANVAFHAQMLGHGGIVCSRVGNDDLGRQLCDYFRRHDLNTQYIQTDPRHPTGTVTVDTTRPDHPTYIIHQDVAWDFIDFDESLRDLMSRAAAVCFGSLAQRSPASRQAIQQCIDAARNALLVFDVNLRQSWYDREVIETSLRKSHIAKMNVDEVRVLAHLFEMPAGDDPAAFAPQLLKRFDLQMVCVTKAEDGCLLAAGQDVVQVPGVKVKVADAVGAGDAFSAALIYASLQGWPLDKIASFANSVGALVATKPGAMPDVQKEYAELLTHHQKE